MPFPLSSHSTNSLLFPQTTPFQWPLQTSNFHLLNSFTVIVRPNFFSKVSFVLFLSLQFPANFFSNLSHFLLLLLCNRFSIMSKCLKYSIILKTHTVLTNAGCDDHISYHSFFNWVMIGDDSFTDDDDSDSSSELAVDPSLTSATSERLPVAP